MNIGVLLTAIGASIAGTLGPLGFLLNEAGFSGLQVAAMRVVFTSVTLLALYPIMFRGSLKPILANWPILLCHSFVGVIGFNIFFFMATEQLGITLAVALFYTAPMWVMIMARLFLGERPHLIQWLLAIGAILGVVLILGMFNSEISISTIGMIYAFIAAISYALYSVIGKIALRKVEANTLLFSSFTLAAPLLLLFPPTWQSFDQMAQTGDLYTISLFLGVSWAGTIIVFFLFIQGLARINASTASVITTMEPLVATLIAVFFLGEILTPSRYLGVALIIGCAALIGLFDARIKKESKD